MLTASLPRKRLELKNLFIYVLTRNLIRFATPSIGSKKKSLKHPHKKFEQEESEPALLQGPQLSLTLRHQGLHGGRMATPLRRSNTGEIIEITAKEKHELA